MKHYNYIFAGAGLSALMTVYKMVKSGKFSGKTILLLDENPKKTNDRTWCFWEEKNETWDEIVTKKWNLALYADPTRLVEIDLAPKKYNQIRSVDFYNFVLDEISKQDNITFENQKVLEVEDLKPELRSFDITELIKEILETLELNSKQKNIELSLRKEYGPVHVHADRPKIGQVLTNLINNSIAYGKDNGKTEISLVVFENLVTIDVSDDGIGIDPKHFPRLFERFYRVEKSRNRNEGGSGLGLAIVKNILDSHGQAINVRSAVNVGSTFSFSLEKSKISGPVSSRGIPLK